MNINVETIRNETHEGIKRIFDDELEKALVSFTNQHVEETIKKAAVAGEFSCEITYDCMFDLVDEYTDDGPKGQLPDRLNALTEDLKNAGFKAEWRIYSADGWPPFHHRLVVSWREPDDKPLFEEPVGSRW